MDSTTITSIVAGKVDITNFISYRIGVDSSTTSSCIIIFKASVFDNGMVSSSTDCTTIRSSVACEIGIGYSGIHTIFRNENSSTGTPSFTNTVIGEITIVYMVIMTIHSYKNSTSWITGTIISEIWIDYIGAVVIWIDSTSALSIIIFKITLSYLGIFTININCSSITICSIIVDEVTIFNFCIFTWNIYACSTGCGVVFKITIINLWIASDNSQGTSGCPSTNIVVSEIGVFNIRATLNINHYAGSCVISKITVANFCITATINSTTIIASEITIFHFSSAFTVNSTRSTWVAVEITICNG